MQKAILYGTGGSGKRLLHELAQTYDIVGFTDSDERRWGGKIENLTIYPTSDIVKRKIDFDVVVVATQPGLEDVKKFLHENGFKDGEIITQYVTFALDARRTFLQNLSKLQASVDYNACVAEAGVFAGDFAKWINRYYSNRKLFLFDTFEGFDARDISEERGLSTAKEGDYSKTSVDVVMGKMTYPDRVILEKGYFPETAEGIEEKFCFVNLDLDLYLPTYNGLNFFKDKMISGGVILIHDYFGDTFDGPRKAVDKFVVENPHLQKVPIGDGLSIMIVGF